MPRPSMDLCPACDRPNADAATACVACGTPLVMHCGACGAVNVRTRRACRRCQAALTRPVAGGPAARDDAGPDTEPAVALALTLRGDMLAGAGPRRPAAPERPTPRSEGLAWPAIAEPAPATPSTSAPSPPAPLSPLEMRHRMKAERRAKVRQRQLRALRDGAPQARSPASDVLLLEPDTGSRVTVATLLEGFGYRVRVVDDAEDVLAASLERRYAAVMLGLGGQGDDVADLCHQLRRQPAFGATPVFAIVDAAGHADRVRVRLAGAYDTLARPVSRGSLARTLNLHGITLPRDPRVGGPPTG